MDIEIAVNRKVLMKERLVMQMAFQKDLCSAIHWLAPENTRHSKRKHIARENIE